MSKPKSRKPAGQMRQSQLITSFGPGAMMDLPDQSVIIGGLDTWTRGDEIDEPRLVDKLKNLFDPPLKSLKLCCPPPDNDDPTAPQTGIRAWQFPEWFITQDIYNEGGSGLVRARMLVHRKRLTKGKFIDDNRKKRVVVPIRFVRACVYGHIGDIDWYVFAHGSRTECKRQLWIEERGTSGDLSEVWVRCECGNGERSIAQAHEAPALLGHCNGSRPWIGPFAYGKCGQPNRLLIRNASNAYFAQGMSVISLPDRNEGLTEAVDSMWDFLEIIESPDEIDRERRREKVRSALKPFTNDEVFKRIKIRRGEIPQPNNPVKHVEFKTLASSEDEIGDDKPGGDFYARNLPQNHWDSPWMSPVERVVLVHRLREVQAQVGFTRFEAVSPDIDGELEVGVRRAELADEISWLPAVENRGEGVFIQFKKDAVEKWMGRSDVNDHGHRLLDGYTAWKNERQGATKKFIEDGGLLPYVLFHSFSHLLISSVALECGYPASSIRERIYSIPDIGYGVLLYTGTTDAEGTLGGLIEVGRRIHKHIRSALELGELCSNDPVCAQHEPSNQHERRFLHGAACHGCLLISETSCEQHNELLDRSLVVPTIDNLGIEFFDA